MAVTNTDVVCTTFFFDISLPVKRDSEATTVALCLVPDATQMLKFTTQTFRL